MQKSVQRPFGTDSRGFTIIEVLITMALAGVVMGAIYTIFISSNRSYRTQDSVADAQQRVRVGIDFVAHDIRMAGLDPLSVGAGIENATGTNLRLTADIDVNGVIDTPLNQERITYDYDSASRTLRRKLYEGTASETAWQPLIDDVSAMSFSYLGAGGAAIAAPVSAANLDNIQAVVIAMTCQGRDGQGRAFTRRLTTQVNLRN